MKRLDHAALVDMAAKRLAKNYKQQPIVLARGQGARLTDVRGETYLDMTAGIAVCCLGHAHPRHVAAIAEQAARLIHVSNLYFIEAQIRLADALCERSFADRVFFCNSGGEANEAALKMARRYQQVVAERPERVTVVSTEGSFHGRTVATVSVTGQEKHRKGFGPLWEPVRFVPYGDIAAARQVLTETPCCAFIVEPVQAEGGIVVPPRGYLKALRELCSETGTVLVFDEVQTGIGRTGTWFAYEQEDCAPDIMTLAKGLGGGVPIGATLATEEVARGFEPLPGEAPPHASTFGGNPLACASALAVLEIIEDEGLLENCRDAGAYLERGLAGLVKKHPRIAREVRGRGLLVGLRVEKDAPAIMGRCREKRLLVSVAGGNVIRFVPPLTVSRAEVDEAVGILGEVLAEREAQDAGGG